MRRIICVEMFLKMTEDDTGKVKVLHLASSFLQYISQYLCNSRDNICAPGLAGYVPRGGGFPRGADDPSGDWLVRDLPMPRGLLYMCKSRIGGLFASINVS